MNTIIPLHKSLFTDRASLIIKNNQFTVSAFRYASGVEGLRVENSQGYLTIYLS